MAKDHSDYAPTIDKLNDLGNICDATLKGDSPRHYSGSPRKGSPTRLSSPSKFTLHSKYLPF